MSHTFQYQGFDVEVAVAVDLTWKGGHTEAGQLGYAAVVRICKAGVAVAVISPLRFGESKGKPFLCEEDALMGGYGAGRRIVDDLLRKRSIDHAPQRLGVAGSAHGMSSA